MPRSTKDNEYGFLTIRLSNNLMSDRINYKDAEQSLEEFLDSCYSVSHRNATV